MLSAGKSNERGLPVFHAVLSKPLARRVHRANHRSPFFVASRLGRLSSGIFIFAAVLTVPGTYDHVLRYREDVKRPWQLRLYRRPGKFRFAFSNRHGDATRGYLLGFPRAGKSVPRKLEIEVQDTIGSTRYPVGDLIGYRGDSKLKQDSAAAIAAELRRLAEERRQSEAGCLPGADYAPLLSRIGAVSASPEEKLQLKVLLDTLYRVNHVRAIARQRRLRARAETMPEWQAQLAHYEALLAEISAPEFLAPHGYRLPISAIPLETVTAELGAVMDALADEGMTTWITYGALLGYERQGALLPHDDDIDLSIHVPGDDHDAVVTNWKRMMNRIKTGYRGFQKNGFVAIELPCGIEVDLFPCWVVNGVVNAYPHVQGELSEDAFFPVVKKDWAGTELRFPARVEQVLAQAYGDTWRVPDPYWKFDWKRCHARFSAFLTMTRT